MSLLMLAGATSSTLSSLLAELLLLHASIFSCLFRLPHQLPTEKKMGIYLFNHIINLNWQYLGTRLILTDDKAFNADS